MSYIRKKDGVFYRQDCGRLMEHRGYALRIHWSHQMLDDLRRMFPTTLNDEIAGVLGVSPRTMIRKARELGLKKDPVWLRSIWEELRKWAHIASRQKGYPGGFRKGEHSCVEHEYKKGHVSTSEEIAHRSASIRKWCIMNPDKVKERAAKAAATRKRNRENQTKS